MLNKSIQQWYNRRIAAGELNSAGWSRKHSQLLRFLGNMWMFDAPPGALRIKSVADLGCGTGDFLMFCHRIRRGLLKPKLSRYIGIDIREDALHAAKERAEALIDDPETPHMVFARSIEEAPALTVDALVCNAAYGFDCQDPVSDIASACKKFRPQIVVADFFSDLRPYEPTESEGYFSYHPWELTRELRRVTGCSRFTIDHSIMPHVFTVGLFFGRTPWEAYENDFSK